MQVTAPYKLKSVMIENFKKNYNMHVSLDVFIIIFPFRRLIKLLTESYARKLTYNVAPSKFNN